MWRSLPSLKGNLDRIQRKRTKPLRDLRKRQRVHVLFYISLFLIELYIFLCFPPFTLPFYPLPLSPCSQFTHMILFFSTFHVDPHMSLLGSSLLSRSSGIVNCRLFFFICFMSKSHLCLNTYDIYLSGSGLPHSIWCFLDLSIGPQISRLFFHSIVLHCVNVPHLLYPSFSQRAFRLFLGSGYDK